MEGRREGKREGRRVRERGEGGIERVLEGKREKEGRGR